MKTNRQQSLNSAKSPVSILLRVIVLIALLVLMVLAIWPVKPHGTSGTDYDAYQFRLKLEKIEESDQSNWTGTQVITESEANGYLERVVYHTVFENGLSSLERNVQSINIDFTRSAFLLTLTSTFGPLRFTYELEGRPEIDDNKININIYSVRLGHLPLIPPLKQMVIKRVYDVFSQLQYEQRIIKSLERVEMTDDHILLTTKRR